MIRTDKTLAYLFIRRTCYVAKANARPFDFTTDQAIKIAAETLPTEWDGKKLSLCRTCVESAVVWTTIQSPAYPGRALTGWSALGGTTAVPGWGDNWIITWFLRFSPPNVRWPLVAPYHDPRDYLRVTNEKIGQICSWHLYSFTFKGESKIIPLLYIYDVVILRSWVDNFNTS